MDNKTFFEKIYKSVNCKDIDEDFSNIEKEIDLLLNESKDKERTLKILICHVEGKNNKTRTNAFLGIIWATMLAIITLIPEMRFIFSVILIVWIYASSFFQKSAEKNDYKSAFITSVLKFKLEELKSEEFTEYKVKIEKKN